MNNLIQEIQARHESSVKQDTEFDDELEFDDPKDWVIELLEAYNECRKDRGDLLAVIKAVGGLVGEWRENALKENISGPTATRKRADELEALLDGGAQ